MFSMTVGDFPVVKPSEVNLMDDIEEILNILEVTQADRRFYPGYIVCDELIKMRKLTKWLEKKIRKLRE